MINIDHILHIFNLLSITFHYRYVIRIQLTNLGAIILIGIDNIIEHYARLNKKQTNNAKDY